MFGTAGMIALLPGPLDIFGASFDVHTLVRERDGRGRYQAVLFAAFARIYATTESLLPARQWLEDLAQRISLEKGVLAGLGILTGGIALTIVALVIWGAIGFGALPTERRCES